MYKKILILYFLMIQSLLSQHYQSIHQQQLEYYNANYVMPERTDTNIVINPFLTEQETHLERYLAITHIGWVQHGRVIILI